MLALPYPLRRDRSFPGCNLAATPPLELSPWKRKAEYNVQRQRRFPSKLVKKRVFVKSSALVLRTSLCPDLKPDPVSSSCTSSSGLRRFKRIKRPAPPALPVICKMFQKDDGCFFFRGAESAPAIFQNRPFGTSYRESVCAPQLSTMAE